MNHPDAAIVASGSSWPKIDRQYVPFSTSVLTAATSWQPQTAVHSASVTQELPSLRTMIVAANSPRRTALCWQCPICSAAATIYAQQQLKKRRCIIDSTAFLCGFLDHLVQNRQLISSRVCSPQVFATCRMCKGKAQALSGHKACLWCCEKVDTH